MCGIVGYVGKNKASNYLLDGLEALEYRGYDSAGIALLENEQITPTKVVGRVEALRKEYNFGQTVSHLGIGHTRWATHGGVTVKNAHPHWDQNKQFYVIHNGIVENHQEIRSLLTRNGYTFYSETDTEVIPNLIDYNFKKCGDITKAFLTSIKELRGAYAVVMITTHSPDTLFAAKLSSPLAIGVGDGEMFIGSDGLPMAGKTDQVLFLQDNEAAIVNNDGYEIINLADDSRISRSPELLELQEGAANLGEFSDFMSKEIHEAPQTVRSAMLGRARAEEGIIKLGGLETVEEQLRYIDRIIIVACGTSYYAGMVGEYLLEEIAGIPVEVQQAANFATAKNLYPGVRQY